MVGNRRKKKHSRWAGGPQRSWLWGRHAVLESLRAGRWIPVELAIDEDALPADTVAELRAVAIRRNIPVVSMSSVDLEQLCRQRDHQGLLARMPPYPYFDGTSAVAKLGPAELVLVLCGIQDPHNFGAILRSAELFQAAAVFVPERGQAEITPHVARSSAGAVNFLPICQSDDLPGLIETLRQRGLQVWAASEKGNLPPRSAPVTGGVALLIGNEGTGVPKELLERSSAHVAIPTTGRVGSLNAAVAAGILCYEFRCRS